MCRMQKVNTDFMFPQGSGNVILQRASDGTPVQWFIAEDAEIVSQV